MIILEDLMARHEGRDEEVLKGETIIFKTNKATFKVTIEDGNDQVDGFISVRKTDAGHLSDRLQVHPIAANKVIIS